MSEQRGCAIRFMGVEGKLADGVYSGTARCYCLTRANLRAVVRGGEVVEAGCPVCGAPAVAMIEPDRHGGLMVTTLQVTVF